MDQEKDYCDYILSLSEKELLDSIDPEVIKMYSNLSEYTRELLLEALEESINDKAVKGK